MILFRMVVSMVFYGLAMNSSNIGGNLFLNYFMSSLAELIGFAGCLTALQRVGRRYVFTVSVLFSGAACIVTIFPVLYASNGTFLPFVFSFEILYFYCQRKSRKKTTLKTIGLNNKLIFSHYPENDHITKKVNNFWFG